MSYNSISVCLIVKNESKNINRCLSSIIGIADEIIIVDTGSTDNTIEICKSFGDKIKIVEYQWKNDFADARNKSLDFATKDWILFLDADEELSFLDAQKFKNLINNPENQIFEGYFVRLVNFIDGNELGDSIVFRIFKNDPDYRFKGKMHEQVINSIELKVGMNKVGSTDIRINHYGYDPNIYNQNDKCKRNIELLLSYNDEDKDGYYYYALGNEYIRSGQNEIALDTFNKSINLTDLSNGVLPIYYPYLMVSVMNLLQSQQKFKDKLNYIKLFKKTCRDFKDLYFHEGVAYLDIGCVSKSIKSFDNFLNCANINSNYAYPSNNFDYFNVPNVLAQLKAANIPNDDTILSSIIIYNKQTDCIIDMVKNLNAISKEVVVAVNDNSFYGVNEIENFCGIIVNTSSSDETEMFFEALRKCKGKYVLKVLPGEMIATQLYNNLFAVLNSTKKDLLQVNISNSQNIMLKQECRIIRNNKRFKKYDDFKLHLNKKKLEVTDIQINQVYEIIAENNNSNIDLNLLDKSTNNSDIDPKKILIGSLINEEVSISEFKNFLFTLKELNAENLVLDYYFMDGSNSKYINSCIEDISKDVDNVYVNIENNSIDYKNNLIKIAMNSQYDYLIILNTNFNLIPNIVHEYLNLSKDVLVSHSKSKKTQDSLIMLSREAIISGINFNKLKTLSEDNEFLMISLKSEVLGLDFIELIN